ncbi:MAG TPA: hypothetical protein VN915_01625 [Elusimicrobiota bacterium]|nr:hypothetical protein [Elusimicrobiota bacterium]
MPRLLAFAVIFSLLGACSSGGGCDGGTSDNKSSSSGSSGGAGGGGPSHGTSETVSFQGLGKKTGGAPASSDPQAAAAALNGEGGKPAPAAVAGNASATAAAPQSVICGGFPYLAADCKTDPVFEQIQKKCCLTGQVLKCEAIPGGARLTGTGCTATPK